jgi:hypothetical protein
MDLIVITLPCNIQQANNAKEFKMLLQRKLNNKTKQGLKGKYTFELFIELAKNDNPINQTDTLTHGLHLYQAEMWSPTASAIIS